MEVANGRPEEPWGRGAWGAEEGEGEINGKDVDVIRY